MAKKFLDELVHWFLINVRGYHDEENLNGGIVTLPKRNQEKTFIDLENFKEIVQQNTLYDVITALGWGEVQYFSSFYYALDNSSPEYNEFIFNGEIAKSYKKLLDEIIKGVFDKLQYFIGSKVVYQILRADRDGNMVFVVTYYLEEEKVRIKDESIKEVKFFKDFALENRVSLLELQNAINQNLYFDLIFSLAKGSYYISKFGYEFDISFLNGEEEYVKDEYIDELTELVSKQIDETLNLLRPSLENNVKAGVGHKVEGNHVILFPGFFIIKN